MLSPFEIKRFADYPMTVIGFHGTSEDVAESVLSGRSELKISQNKYDWLGHGAYFWENAPERAWQWADTWAKKRGKKPAVVGAIIQIGHCLNLMDKSSNAALKATHSALMNFCPANGRVLPTNNGKLHDLDCLIINIVNKISDNKGNPYDTVRAAFIEGNPVFPGSTIMDDTHIQICVRDPKKSIVAYFRPRTIQS